MKLVGWLSWAANRLEAQPDEAGGKSKFVDLAPTDQADASGVYSGALIEATENPRVMNIALTGPYGSGKSSIIKSFLKVYQRPVLQISLAAFLPEAVSSAGQVSRQEIERSILQQMLYGADANRLPLSRFKRIQTPGRWSALASLFTLLGLVACWHLFRSRDAIMSGAYFQPLSVQNWLDPLAFVVGGCFLWLIIHQLYVSSFGISLKSISLKDIEIAPKVATEESILNKHLDEIIYFFQSTKYDLVVIEDLDRFNNPDIFVTLREINALVNANAGVRRRVRFLYALRDDMFVNIDRTKFFEFIIPVIPIINSSNSIDKVLEQGRRLSIDTSLDKQFVREVSRYLNDLRLIRNIFNEYAIYVANLEPEGERNLDATKLLAVLIYKNVFPSDFENLHRGRGDLAKILQGHERYVANREARLAADIARLEAQIEASERQVPRDHAELAKIYAMELIELIPDGFTHIGVDQNNMVSLMALAQSERLDELLAGSTLFVRSQYQGLQYLPAPALQAKLKAAAAFQQRKEEIEARSAASRETIARTIAGLRTKLAGVRMAKFSEIIRDSSDELEAAFEAFGEDTDLARYLVLEGYLDDTYYQYTSLFHSGRLSPSDNKFLIRIRGFSNPDPSFQIDNPREVIAAMREEDFGREYVLNVKIVDCLLADRSSYEAQTTRLVEFVASHFAECEDFFAAYYATGRETPTLIERLAKSWQGFVPAALASPGSLTHVTRILSHLPEARLKSLAAARPELPAFVSTRLPEILGLGIDFDPERLRALKFEVTSLAALEAHPAFVRVLFDEGLFKITFDNLAFVFRAVLGVENEAKLREQNYTMAIQTASLPLLAKIEGQFGNYLEAVLLRSPDNRFESVPAMRRVLERTDVDRDGLVRFLAMQTAFLPTLEGTPPNLHAVLFETCRIEPTWENCLYYIGQDNFEPEVLTDYLNRPEIVKVLGCEPLPTEDTAEPLRTFLIENDSLSEQAYATYMSMLPTRQEAFPDDLSHGKIRILVEQNRVHFSADALARLADDRPSAATFVRNNIDDFFALEHELSLDDDLREAILTTDISDENRLRIVRSMDLAGLSGNPSRAALVGGIVARNGVAVDELEADAARAVILASSPLHTQVSLLNLLHLRFDNPGVRDLLRALPHPLPSIGPGWSTPKLPANDTNRAFAIWLQARGFISSWKQGGFFDNDIRLNMFRKSPGEGLE